MWYWGECKEGQSYRRLENILWSLLCNWMNQASIRKQWGIAYLIFSWKVYCRVHNIPLSYRFLGTSVHFLSLWFFKMYFNITPIYTWDFHVISFLLGPWPYVHTIFYLLWVMCVSLISSPLIWYSKSLYNWCLRLSTTCKK
jgi:hypothetical protein